MKPMGKSKMAKGHGNAAFERSAKDKDNSRVKESSKKDNVADKKQFMGFGKSIRKG